VDKKLRICTIGGGSGMPVVNRALVRAGFGNISSIVTTFDSGGDTGRMRTDERGSVLAFSDYWRSLISLWKDGKKRVVWGEMLSWRDGRGRNFGNIFFQFMAEKSGSLGEVDSLFEKLVDVKLRGRVIPVASKPADICFSTLSGKKYRGEHNLDDLRMSLDQVTKIWLEPRVKANDEAIEAVLKAEVVIICPGSMYGSVLVNFLPTGMVGAYRKSRARKLLMTNIMSSANENDNYNQDDYKMLFAKYLGGGKFFDLVVMADLKVLSGRRLKRVLKLYEWEHSYPIKFYKKSYQKTLLVDVAIIEEKNDRLRHSEIKLANFFEKVKI